MCKRKSSSINVYRTGPMVIKYNVSNVNLSNLRGSTEFSRAIGGCLKRDFTAPDYKFHDDPFLIPYNSMQKRDYLLSKQGGKRAARYVLNQHPELFNKNLIEMDPVIKRLLPKIKITQVTKD
jgi:pentatricopeptide repeat domain-containing protein 3